jgi:RNA polymerase sigma-70 factor (ECF subfamily)
VEAWHTAGRDAASTPPGGAPPSDAELMARLAKGDREALTPLMERHYRRLYRIALGYLRDPDDALDAVQEVFVKAFQHAARWDPGSEAGAWLTRIAVNQAIDSYRRARRRRATMSPLEEGDRHASLEAGDVSPERHAQGRQIASRIDSALRTLPERQRAVFVLRHYESMSLDEIAAALRMNLGTVKSSLHRAIQSLRGRLEGLHA